MERPKGPSHPCWNSSSSPTYPSPLERKHEGHAHIQMSPLSASWLEKRDLFPAWSGKNSWHSRRISRGGALHRKGQRNSKVVPPFPEWPRYHSPFNRNLFSVHCLDFHAEDRLTPRWHIGQLCGKASWESLVGKPRGKALRESHRSLDPLDGMRDTAATAQEESPRACPDSRL